MRYGEAGQSHLLPFLGAAALFAALTITAHSLVLGLAAVIAGPVPAAQTALSLSRKAVSGAAQEEAASVAEAAPESTGTAASLPEAAVPAGNIENYLVELLGDDARPEGAGAVIEKITRKAAVKSTLPAARAASRTTPGRRRRTLPPRSKTRCPLPLKRTAPTRRFW